MHNIDNREFVVTWMNSNNLDEVAKNMKIPRESVSAKASALRAKGVRLPRMKQVLKSGSLEIAQLNSLVKKYENKHEKSK